MAAASAREVRPALIPLSKLRFGVEGNGPGLALTEASSSPGWSATGRLVQLTMHFDLTGDCGGQESGGRDSRRAGLREAHGLHAALSVSEAGLAEQAALVAAERALDVRRSPYCF